MSKKAVVLLSGGLDSTTVLAVALRDGYEVTALSFDYGQRHRVELEAARRVVKQFGVKRHEVVKLDFSFARTSALTSSIAVPKERSEKEMSGNIPVTYVPARNTIFLSYALGVAEVVGASALFIGVNAIDYSGYPDCRPEYISAFQAMANLATKASIEAQKVRIYTPLVKLTKAQIVQLGRELGVDYALTSSCYDPSEDGEACGKCDSCQLRMKGFSENGLADPIAYRS
jgi:7-cyano-7-deazaguanine synthase